MNLLQKLSGQIADGTIKPKDTLQDWFDTLEDADFEELERLVTMQEDDPESEDEDSEIIGQLVAALYSVETSAIEVGESGLKVADIPEDEFFKLVNSFLFLLPFYYWLKQGLLTTSTKISFLANKENKIAVTLTEYGKQ
ncbi:MAG: hypothetical protein GY765_06955 [bacterium]|nr:hypothetical protein [bacterium]